MIGSDEPPCRGVTACGVIARADFKPLPNHANMRRFAEFVKLLKRGSVLPEIAFGEQVHDAHEIRHLVAPVFWIHAASFTPPCGPLFLKVSTKSFCASMTMRSVNATATPETIWRKVYGPEWVVARQHKPIKPFVDTRAVGITPINKKRASVLGELFAPSEPEHAIVATAVNDEHPVIETLLIFERHPVPFRVLSEGAYLFTETPRTLIGKPINDIAEQVPFFDADLDVHCLFPFVPKVRLSM